MPYWDYFSPETENVIPANLLHKSQMAICGIRREAGITRTHSLHVFSKGVTTEGKTATMR
tara:strand:- start:665 stop:844 length:180 start_codon:yes stop_codon:yes gene_type:complete